MQYIFGHGAEDVQLICNYILCCLDYALFSAIYSHEVNSCEINFHVVNSYYINFPHIICRSTTEKLMFLEYNNNNYHSALMSD